MEKLCPGATFPGIRQCSLAGGGALRHQELMELIAELITAGEGCGHEKNTAFLFFVQCSLLQCAAMAWAGGPLLTDRNCNPVVFPASAMPIPYTVDQGDLGVFSNSRGNGYCG